MLCIAEASRMDYVLRQVRVSSRSPKTSTGVGFEPTTFGLVLQRSTN